MAATYPAVRIDPQSGAMLAEKLAIQSDDSPGLFADFDRGVTGVPLDFYDPPQPYHLTSVTNPGTSMVYANDILLDPLPGAVRFINNATGSSFFTWSDPLLIPSQEHYGSMYIYPEGKPTSNLRFIFFGDTSGNTAGALRIDQNAQKISILNRTNVVVATSADVGAFPKWLRLVWHLFHNPANQAQGLGELTIYAGHSTTPLVPKLSVIGDFGALPFSVCKVGNYNGSNLSNIGLRIAAVAVNCKSEPNPWHSPRHIQQIVKDKSGQSLFEIWNDGSMVRRLERTVAHQPGGAYHYMHYPGDVSFRVDPTGGLMLGINGNYGSSVDYNPFKLNDIFINAQTGRVSAASADFCLVNDPSDIAFSRKFPMYGTDRVGTDASTTAGSKVVNFSTLKLRLLDIGRSFTVAGIDTHIVELLSETSCTMDVPFPNTASNVAWSAKEFPYPADRMSGCLGGNAHIGQLRLTIPYAPFIRESTIGTCTFSINNPTTVTKNGHKLVAGEPVVFSTTGTLPTGITAGQTYYVISTGLVSNSFQVSATPGGVGIGASGTQSGTHTVSRPLAIVTSGSPNVTIPGFTQTDVGRALLFNDNLGLGEFVINSVTGDTVAVGNLNGGGFPQFNDPGAKWAMAGGQFDHEVMPNYQPFTMVMGTSGGGARQWASTPKYSCPTKVEFQVGTSDADDAGIGVGLTDGTGVHTVLAVDGGKQAVGRVVSFGGHAWVCDPGRTIGYQPAVGVGAAVTQQTDKSTAVTINATSGKITMNNANMNAGDIVAFTVNNSFVTASDVIIVNIQTQTTAKTYRAQVASVLAGSFTIEVQNISAIAKANGLILNFAIIKGAGAS